jgi:probable phosphoglycerate mutase
VTGSWSAPLRRASDLIIVAGESKRTSVVVEADGGSRGNPGPAGYGAVLRDAHSGEVIAEAAASIGRASNNVAEYRGLIAGLELYADHTPGATLEVRMDSKLVIEQMAGRWRVKHPDMRPLALTARRLAPSMVTWTWVPRARNAAADRLANLAMDAAARGETYVVGGPRALDGEDVADADLAMGIAPEAPEHPAPGAGPRTWANAMPGWSDTLGSETTVVLVRHGETDNTVARVFCGPGGSDPGLNAVGGEQVRRTAAALAHDLKVDVILTSPLRRARETAEMVATELGMSALQADGFRECGFGEWDGLTLQQVRERWPDELDSWLESHDVAPPGGESIVEVQQRVEDELRQTVSTYAGQTVVVVTHVNPIKLVVRACLDAPLYALHRMLVSPASLTVVSFYASGDSVLHQFSATP